MPGHIPVEKMNSKTKTNKSRGRFLFLGAFAAAAVWAVVQFSGLFPSI
ncbi:hypothetical protein [Alkalicoccus urumqiensis]|nr:hypothetical protein [Alkalicoccus urumqiensis]